ncbi:MAG: hypothetical protein J6V95_09430 [Bacteroidaceae bacterium]|nr:hypothetical protein [Bacteroidaceae bacterium]
MNKYIKLITKSVLGLMTVGVIVSCESDTWKDHYSVHSDGNESIESLGKTIASIPEASNFVEALKTTFMYNGDSISTLTYWDFLNDNQFLTVWLPNNASISQADWDIYMSTDDDKDHKKVGTEFILNHIARFSHPVGSDTHEKVKMMSNKTYRSVEGSIGGVGYIKKNERCTNGILHQLDSKIVYRPNLYDYITGSYKSKSVNGNDYNYKTALGSWLAKYTKEELDENRSIPGEVNDKGEIEYIDKVIIRSNSVLQKYGYIDVEDSNFIVVLPRPAVWDSVYEALKGYFSYEPEVEGRDSLQSYWTNSVMITDAFFNRNLQKSIQDSATSTQFKWSERMTEKYPYHVFFKPYLDGGLFADSTATAPKGVIDSVECSNGVIYVRNDWPYSDSVFRRPIKVEGESLVDAELQLRPKNARYWINDSTYKTVRVMEISKSTDQFEVEYLIPNHLRGKYRIKLVFFRNTEENKQSNINLTLKYNSKPVQTLYTGSAMGRTQSWNVGRYEDRPDTVIVGVPWNSATVTDKTFDFPNGNYDNGAGKISLTIKANKATTQNKTTKKLWLDCIILEPVFE